MAVGWRPGTPWQSVILAGGRQCEMPSRVSGACRRAQGRPSAADGYGLAAPRRRVRGIWLRYRSDAPGSTSRWQSIRYSQAQGSAKRDCQSACPQRPASGWM